MRGAKLLDLVRVTRATIAAWAGVAPSTYDGWVKGKHQPNPTALRRLAQHARDHARKVERLASQILEHLDSEER